MYTSALVVYDGSPNVTLKELNDALAELHIPAIVYVIISIIVGVIGNSLVIYVYKTKSRRSNHRYFILSVAVMDLLACLTGMPFLVYSLRYPYMMDSVVGCKTLRAFHYFVNNSAGLLLVVISVERFRKICRPFKRQLTTRQTLKLCWGTILFSALVGAPAGYFFTATPIETKVNNITGWECYSHNPGFEYYQLLLMLETFVSITIFAILYGFIIRKVWTNDQFLQALKSLKWRGGSQSDNNTSNGREYSEDYDSCVSRDIPEGSKDSSKPFITQNEKAQIDEQVDYRPTNGNGQQDETSLESSPALLRRTDNMLQTARADIGAVPQADTARSGTSSSSRSLWRLSKELFKRSNENGKKHIERSTSDTALNRVKQPQKFNTLTPTSRMAITQALRRKEKQDSQFSRASTSSGKHSKTTIRVTVMLFLVSIMFALSFIPHLVLMIITAHNKSFLDNMNRREIILYQFFLRIFILNNVVNPIIYIFFDSKFRSDCKEVFKQAWRRLTMCC